MPSDPPPAEDQGPRGAPRAGEASSLPRGTLRAPFPWFGGKSRAAGLIWDRLGEVDSYNEPFAGSLAVLLGRPHEPRVETVNDLDCYLSNFWRALQAAPAEVAKWADYPVSETDLHARHQWLVKEAGFQAKMKADPDFYDAKVAGWWVWGQCLWIGSGWCQTSGESAKKPADGGRGQRGIFTETVRKYRDQNPQGTAHQKRRPHLSGEQGIIGKKEQPNGTSHQAKRPLLRDRGADGIDGQGARRWQGGGQGGGSGVHAPRLTQQLPQSLPQLGGDGSGAQRGLLSEGVRSQGLYDYLGALSARLRRVRVCCGDWRRVLTPSVTTYIGVTGVVLDPPYSHELRERCYSEDHDVSGEVREWALEHGGNPRFRIALCGYEGEHAMPPEWACVEWKAHGGYSRSERGRANRARERIWFSPHCLAGTIAQQGDLAL